MRAAPPSGGAPLRIAAVCAALAALCVAVYAPALSNGFVWDDELFITRNEAVSGGLSSESLRWAFTTFHTGNWYPLTWISHLVDVELFGLAPRGHHLVSLLFHAANAILTFLLLRRMTGALWQGAIVAALFAVHPLHVESVAWAAERKDVLSTLLWLLALQAWLGWLRRPAGGRYLLASALYALSLLAKPMGVTLPFLLLLLDWWPLGRFARGRRGALFVEKLPLFALAAVFSVVAYVAQASVGAVGSIPLEVRVANALLSVWRYLGKTLWPRGLALFYPFPSEAPSLLATILAAAALAAATVAVLAVRRRAPALAVGWFWFLGTLVPVIGLVQIGSQALADRYTYVPLTGVFVLATWGAGAIAAVDRRVRPWLAPAALAIVVALTLAARAQVRLWRDPVTAFTNALAVTGDNQVAHYLLAMYHFDRGDDPLAEKHARAAIAIAGDDPSGHSSLAQVLERTGRVEEAEAEYRAALGANPRLAEAHNNLGVLLSAAGRQGEAAFHLQQAVAFKPEYVPARSNLGRLLARQGRVDEALPHFREAVRLSPRQALHHADLGAALAALGRWDEAVPALEKALRLDPGLGIARENLDRALAARATAAPRGGFRAPGERRP